VNQIRRQGHLCAACKIRTMWMTSPASRSNSAKTASIPASALQRSLDELVSIQYLSSWDVRPMVSKPGYKLVLMPGGELLHVLAISQRKQLTDGVTEEQPSTEQQATLQALLERRHQSGKSGIEVPASFNSSRRQRQKVSRCIQARKLV
jgi:hypothetical protein